MADVVAAVAVVVVVAVVAVVEEEGNLFVMIISYKCYRRVPFV